MDIIDAHQHLRSEPNALEELAQRSEEAGITKVCLSACGEQYNQPGNDAVRQAFERFPDLIVGMGYIRLGLDPPEIVDELHDQGFRGAKVISPLKRYSDKAFYPIYEKLAARGMPILFHTGVVARFGKDGAFDTASERMRPVFLDAIARAFPELTLIGAHLGAPWYDEACAVAAANPNVYFDLSGAIGLLADKPPLFFDMLTFWERAKPKLLFGVDGEYTKKNRVIARFQRLMNKLDFSAELRRAVFHGNMAKILGLRGDTA